MPAYPVSPVYPVRRPELTLAASCEGKPRVFDGVRLDLVDDLRGEILARARTEPTAGSLNRGGWKSSEGLFAWGVSSITELMTTLSSEYLNGCRPIGWAMVNREGSHHPKHHHANAIVSAVYCVDPGEEPFSPTVFYPPSQAEPIEVASRAGRLIIFPVLWHSVPPYLGKKPRITIAMDIRR